MALEDERASRIGREQELHLGAGQRDVVAVQVELVVVVQLALAVVLVAHASNFHW